MTSLSLLKDKLGDVLTSLTERERKVLELRFGLTIRPGCNRPLAFTLAGSMGITPTSLAIITRSSCVR